MKQSTEENEMSWAEIGAAILGITVMQTVVSVGRAQWLLWKSKEDRKLTDAVRKLTKCKRLRVFILSRKDMLEAFVFPSGEIFISEELYKVLDQEEALAIALHEAGHVVLHTQTCTSLCKSGVLLGLLGKDVPYFVSLAASLLSGMGCTAWHERLADSYAMRLGYGPSLASALAKLYENSDPVPPSFLGFPSMIGEKIDDLLRIHPEIGKRMETLAGVRQTQSSSNQEFRPHYSRTS